MKRPTQRGANLVEAALVLPVLLLLTFGIIELGHAYSVYQTITNAAREGARYSVAPAPGTTTLPTDASVQTYVCNYLNAGTVTCDSSASTHATVSVCQNCPATTGSICSNSCNSSVPITGTLVGAAITYTQVDISVPYTFVVLPGSVTIHSQAVMRNENTN
jgi:Flp pilus assembly protein TadG